MPARTKIPRQFRIMYMALRDAGYQRHQAIAYVNDGMTNWQEFTRRAPERLTIAAGRAIEAHITMGTYTDMPQRSRFVPLAKTKHGRKFNLE
jgi:hypothetical protein